MYVIQRRFVEYDKWEVMHSCGRMKTLKEAQDALATVPKFPYHRIAEEYTQVRYRAIKTLAVTT